MEIQGVILNQEQQEQLFRSGWIPESLDVTTGEEALFFGGIDTEKNLVAIAVWNISGAVRREAGLEYVFVRRQSRGQGVGLSLLRFCAEQLQQLGTRQLTGEWQDDAQELERVTHFLQKAGFLPTMETAPVVRYAPGQFQGSELEKLKTAQQDLWKAMVRIEDYRDRRLQKLLAQYETGGFYIAERDFEPELCRFYLEGGEIKGAACMRRTRNGDLKNLKGYLAPDLKNKFAMTLLVAAQIQALRGTIRPGTGIYMRFYRAGFYEAARKLFGEGEAEYCFREYECRMGGR